MAIEKFRTRIFAVSKLTVNGQMVLPYGTTAPDLTDNGEIRIHHLTGTAYLQFQSSGTVYTLRMPTAAAGGTIAVTSAAT